jgi:hypothetical protein
LAGEIKVVRDLIVSGQVLKAAESTAGELD